jgi:hypothetical protein
MSPSAQSSVGRHSKDAALCQMRCVFFFALVMRSALLAYRQSRCLYATGRL